MSTYVECFWKVWDCYVVNRIAVQLVVIRAKAETGGVTFYLPSGKLLILQLSTIK